MTSPASSLADAARFAGTYATDTGATLRLVQRGLFLHVTGEPERFGLGMSFNGRLVIAVGPRDKVEIGAYRIDGHGNQLDGLWIPPGATSDDCTGCGTEQSVADATGGDGLYRIDRAVAIDGSAYHGTLSITPMPGSSRTAPPPRPVALQWTLHDGNYNSFGIAFADAIYTTFSFAPDKPHAIAVYERIDEKSLRGVILSSGQSSITPETLRRIT